MTQPFRQSCTGADPERPVNLRNINNLAAFADFEVHCPLTKLLADTDHQLTGHLELCWLDDHFESIARLLIYFTVVRDPGSLKWSFERIATKCGAHLLQDFPTFFGANFFTVIAMRRNPCDYQQRDILSPYDMQNSSVHSIVSHIVLSGKGCSRL